MPSFQNYIFGHFACRPIGLEGYKCNDGCMPWFTKVRIGQRILCYYDQGLHYLNEAESKCPPPSHWLIVPRNAQENEDFKALLSSLNLGNHYGAALGISKKNGKFVDSQNKEISYRKGPFF